VPVWDAADAAPHARQRFVTERRAVKRVRCASNPARAARHRVGITLNNIDWITTTPALNRMRTARASPHAAESTTHCDDADEHIERVRHRAAPQPVPWLFSSLGSPSLLDEVEAVDVVDEAVLVVVDAVLGISPSLVQMIGADDDDIRS